MLIIIANIYTADSVHVVKDHLIQTLDTYLILLNKLIFKSIVKV